MLPRQDLLNFLLGSPVSAKPDSVFLSQSSFPVVYDILALHLCNSLVASSMGCGGLCSAAIDAHDG